MSLHPGGHVRAADGTTARVPSRNAHSRAALSSGFPCGWIPWFSTAKPGANFPRSYNIMKQNSTQFTILTHICCEKLFFKGKKVVIKTSTIPFHRTPPSCICTTFLKCKLLVSSFILLVIICAMANTFHNILPNI